MSTLGQLCQVAALIILPIGMMMELTGALGRDVGIAEYLIFLVFCICLFYVGRMIDRRSKA